MSQSTLLNCKKCGTLFLKGNRDVCENCFRAEMRLADSIKSFVLKNEKKLTLDEISDALDLKKTEIEEFFEKGRLFSILPKLIIKCKFCGVEIPDDQKTGFVCQKCMQKFSPATRSNAQNTEDGLEVKVRQRVDYASRKTRCDFIWNKEL